MIHLTETQLTELHNIQMDMLLEIKKICEKHHIRYSLIGGTLLGAVRHQGFIPWDDDIDVGMLRKDYEKFRKISRRELDPEKYYFQDDRNTEGYRWGYGKLRRKNTVFLRENQAHLNFGQEIFIDIFPLDYAPDHMFFRMLHAFHCFCIRKCLWAPVGMRVGQKKVERCIYKLLSYIPKKVIYRHYYTYIRKVGKTETVRLNLFPTNKPFGFPVSFFQDLIEVVFEGEKFMGTKEYDQYLKIKYGNYMELPPIEKRKVHPVSKIKLLGDDSLNETIKKIL